MKKIVLTGLAVMILALTGCQALGDKAEAVPGSDSGEVVASGGSGSRAEPPWRERQIVALKQRERQETALEEWGRERASLVRRKALP